jgi:hypothetical protein
MGNARTLIAFPNPYRLPITDPKRNFVVGNKKKKKEKGEALKRKALRFNR